MSVFVISFSLKDGKGIDTRLCSTRSGRSRLIMMSDMTVRYLTQSHWSSRTISPEELSVHLEHTFTLEDSWAFGCDSPFFAHSLGTLNGWLDSHLPPLRT